MSNQDDEILTALMAAEAEIAKLAAGLDDLRTVIRNLRIDLRESRKYQRR